jgi:hypothetical protein
MCIKSYTLLNSRKIIKKKEPWRYRHSYIREAALLFRQRVVVLVNYTESNYLYIIYTVAYI